MICLTAQRPLSQYGALPNKGWDSRLHRGRSNPLSKKPGADPHTGICAGAVGGNWPSFFYAFTAPLSKGKMIRFTIRTAANIVIAAGLLLLAKVIYSAATGSLSVQLFAQPQGSWRLTMYALGLSFPVPFHVISVGLILKRRWLSPFWAKAAFSAVVMSGCWLGVALGIKLLVL